MELQDPAFPPSKPLYCVELARRLFSHILLLDTFNMGPIYKTKPYFPEGKSGWNRLTLGSFTTTAAENYSEELLMTSTSADVPPTHPWEL